jgi:DNA-binding NarL/FixJ family response regulator
LESSIRVLVVDDYAPFRHFVRSTLQKQPELQIVCEVSDGLEAVQRTQELQPDLILLDIGLPTLNGIEAARRIRELSPTSKILFVSEHRSWDIAEEALRSGASGYVVKSEASNELLSAVESVLRDRQFVSASLQGRDLADSPDARAHHHREKVGAPMPLPNMGIARHHEVGFYSDERRCLQHVTQFVGTALKAENAAVVVATASHLHSLLLSLRAYGLDIGAAIEQGRYITLDAADALTTFMIHGLPDPIRFMKAFGNLILTAANAARGEHPRVAVFGECVQLVWAQGNAESVIRMEQLGNQLVNEYDVDILCGYSLDGFRDMTDGPIYQRICAEHSAIHSL